MAGCNHKCGFRGVTWCLVAVCSFALLIWAKLRLVTGFPRTAYAVPEEVQRPSKKPAPEKPLPAKTGQANNSQAGSSQSK